MAEAFETANDAIDSLEGDETYDEAEYPLRDFSSKEVAIFNSTRIRALEEGVLPPGSVDAEDVAFTPTGSIAATDVQAAIAEVAAEAGGGGGWPVEAFIVGFPVPKNQTNFDNVGDPSGEAPIFGTRFSDNTNGSWIEWDVALAEGTWCLDVKSWEHDAAGILVFSLDGTDLTDAPFSASGDSYDTYAASSQPNSPPERIAANITVADSGVYALRATVTGKNASSSGHTTNLIWLSMRRVGA